VRRKRYKDCYYTFWDLLSKMEKRRISKEKYIWTCKGIRDSKVEHRSGISGRKFIIHELRYWFKRIFSKREPWEISAHDYFIGTRKL